jgi:hypothetical protein
MEVDMTFTVTADGETRQWQIVAVTTFSGRSYAVAGRVPIAGEDRVHLRLLRWSKEGDAIVLSLLDSPDEHRRVWESLGWGEYLLRAFAPDPEKAN